jgi:hypothetical protein
MLADKVLRCDCGYEVGSPAKPRSWTRFRRHAWEAHGIDFSVELALDVVRRAGLSRAANTTKTESAATSR